LKISQIPKERVDQVLFKFLESVYLFEKRETALFGVTWDEVYLLQLLLKHGPMAVSELAGKLKMAAFMTSRMVTRLAAKNFTKRDKTSGDRRVTIVSITDIGKQKIDVIEGYNYQVVSSSFANLANIDIQNLMGSIEKLDEVLGLK
jgi:DNA-binding MarR family transcriptional regulator